MRAARLLTLLSLLQSDRSITAGELAQRLEVSERTVLRDLEALSGSGVPVYAVRGRYGGFRLLHPMERSVPSLTSPQSGGRRLRRVRVRLAPTALQHALALGRPESWRRRAGAVPAADRPEWIEGSFRFDSYETARSELLALGPDVEVLLPIELRAEMAEIGRRIGELHEP